MVANVGSFSGILQLLSANCIRFYVVKNSFHINRYLDVYPRTPVIIFQNLSILSALYILESSCLTSTL